MNQNATASSAQLTYAHLLFYGCWVGLAIMFVTYFLYVFGIVSPHIPLDQLPDYWGKPVSHYLEAANVPTGWGWTALLDQGDFMNFIGIVVLAGLSVVCYISLIVDFLRRNRYLMLAIASAEVLVLLLAASGIVGAGGH